MLTRTRKAQSIATRYSANVWRTLCVGLIILAADASLAAEPADLLKDFPRSQLAIATGAQDHVVIDIYIASTSKQKTQGLMFVRAMPTTEGMLFTYAQPTKISMWMKNTYIPLDMVFIAADSRIASIHENATPHSTSIIESDGTAKAVLELNSGAAKKLGIKPGDQVLYPYTGDTTDPDGA